MYLCSFVQKNYRKDKPETKKNGYLQGWARKMVGKREREGSGEGDVEVVVTP